MVRQFFCSEIDMLCTTPCFIHWFTGSLFLCFVNQIMNLMQIVWQVVWQVVGFDRFKSSEKGLIIVWQIKNLFDKKFHPAQNQVVWQMQMKIEKTRIIWQQSVWQIQTVFDRTYLTMYLTISLVWQNTNQIWQVVLKTHHLFDKVYVFARVICIK